MRGKQALHKTPLTANFKHFTHKFMDILTLNNQQQLGIEPLDKRVRLIVYNNGVENVCRKEHIKNLERFIQSGDNHLFKGRLQLHKNDDAIAIKVKGHIVGSVSNEAFKYCLENAKQEAKNA
jgi:hypothetical protein